MRTQASLTWADRCPKRLPNRRSGTYPLRCNQQLPRPPDTESFRNSTKQGAARGSELYNKLKDNPGVIVGKFNNDNIEDFVALIRNSITKAYSWSPHGQLIDKNNIEKYDVYAVNLAVCYGLGSGKFDCKLIPGAMLGPYGESIPGIFGEVYLPTDFALNKTSTGQYVCTTLVLNVQLGGMHQ